MSKIQASPDVERVPKDQFPRFVSIYLNDCSQRVNGNLDFQQNIRGQILTGTFTGAGQISISHTLGVVPTGYLIFRKSADINIYDGTTAFSTTSIYLRSTGAGSITVFVF